MLEPLARSDGFIESVKLFLEDPFNDDAVDLAIARWPLSPEWRCGKEFLEVSRDRLFVTPGDTLECGCGLTTCLLSPMASLLGKRYLALEHIDQYLIDVRSAAGLEEEVHLTHLKDYGTYHWYDIEGMPRLDISLLLVDGPPRNTPGGRYGALPILMDQMRDDCVVILDDVERPEERWVLKQWKRDYPEVEVVEINHVPKVEPEIRIVNPGGGGHGVDIR